MSWFDICKCGDKRNIHKKGKYECYNCSCEKFDLEYSQNTSKVTKC